MLVPPMLETSDLSVMDNKQRIDLRGSGDNGGAPN
jgi:hypothetical protein